MPRIGAVSRQTLKRKKAALVPFYSEFPLAVSPQMAAWVQKELSWHWEVCVGEMHDGEAKPRSPCPAEHSAWVSPQQLGHSDSRGPPAKPRARRGMGQASLISIPHT